jgi:hypothetical protein
MNQPKKMSVREVIALVFSAAILLGTAVYWVVQVQAVRETLRLAGG